MLAPAVAGCPSAAPGCYWLQWGLLRPLHLLWQLLLEALMLCKVCYRWLNDVTVLHCIVIGASVHLIICVTGRLLHDYLLAAAMCCQPSAVSGTCCCCRCW
jgi:hypothetical protein